MPKTLKALFGLDPWSGIRNPEGIPYYLKRGIASMLWKENNEAPKAYNARTLGKDFVRAYKIIGASLVRAGHLKKPSTIRGKVALTAQGEQRERELKIPKTKEDRDRLKRARRAVEWLDDVLVKLKADLEAEVIKETTV